jgi:hypothetical protein
MAIGVADSLIDQPHLYRQVDETIRQLRDALPKRISGNRTLVRSALAFARRAAQVPEAACGY